MTADRAALLARVEAFAVDGPDAPALPFAARLARENGWSRPYADRVIREYKRFAYLAAAGFGPVCPSEDVDAAWHLHLTYTRSYWHRFCGDVLGTPLHHEPTKGGAAEHRKHLAMYAHTLAAYREAFGEAPPPDIWTPAADRFGADLRHRTVNTARNWVVPKRAVRTAAALAAGAAAFAVLLPGCNGGLNPFDLVGSEFLTVLIPLLVAAVPIGWFFRWTRRTPLPQPGDEELTLTWEQSAFLAGGYPRLVAAAVARLVNARVLRPEGDQLVRAEGSVSGSLSGTEQAVLSHLPLTQSGMKTLRDAVEAKFGAEAARLEGEGFVLTPAGRAGVRCLGAVPILAVLLALGLPRLLTGLANGKPVQYLIMALVLGMFGVLVAVLGVPRLTRRGQAVLGRQRERYATLKAGAQADPSLALALFGTAVLAGTSAAFLQTWYPRQASAGSSSGCGGGCGTAGGGGCGGDGGGGGGGGCGGCGGGGGGD